MWLMMMVSDIDIHKNRAREKNKKEIREFIAGWGVGPDIMMVKTVGNKGEQCP
jgi:hypothetical protein